MDQATELRSLVRQTTVAFAPLKARPRRIVVFGGKGGVGATTVAANLAASLAQQGERCLLCDAAGGDVALQLRLEPRHTLAEVLSGNRTANEAVVNGPANVQVLCGERELPRWHETSEHTWNRLLAQFDLLAPPPETVVIDAGSRLDPPARLLWQSADHVILVSTVETAAVMNAYAAVKSLDNPARPTSIELLLNRVAGDAAADEAQQRLAHACRRFLGLLLRGLGALPEDTHIAEAARRGEPFVLAAPACAASVALRQAVRALATKATAKKAA